MINLHSPFINQTAIKYLKKCVNSGWVSTGGKLVENFEKKICKFTGAKYSIACNSGTSALHISLKLADVRPGDEVLAPTLTFVATINAILYNSCRPIFMDCDEFFNIDVQKTLEFLKTNTYRKNKFTFNKKTRRKISALIVTHVWGNAVDLEKLISECKKRKIKIVEDASESLGTRYKKGNNHTGTLGSLGVISFNANKIITTGSGGIILTNDKKIANRAKYLTTQAKNDPVFFVHNEVGYNYRMTNISAALGLSQLKDLNLFIKKKKNIRNFYLKKMAQFKNLKIAKCPPYATNNNWLNILNINYKKRPLRNKIIKKMYNSKIIVRPIWKLNHLQKPFSKFQNYKIKKAYNLVKTSICLPSSPSLNLKDLNKIISNLNE